MDILDIFINEVADGIANKARDKAPVDTGNLKGDIRVWNSRGGKGVAYIGNTKAAPYAKFVHDGTKPYTISVKNKKVLANKKLGKIYGKKVNHPGIKANPYFKNAANEYLKSRDYTRAKNRYIKSLEDEIFKGIMR
ncbi:MAG: HK97 gp10 family phage protein [Campylobacter sp.]|nr:HK97 gp10 family phage protein [Campylobacter sp.]